MIDPRSVLSDVPTDQAFWFFNGTVVRNIYELAREIENLDGYGFIYHANPDHDDFAKWICEVIGDYELADKLCNASSKQQYQRILRKRIMQLEEADILCRPGLHCAPVTHRTLGTFPQGTVRLSPGYFTSDEDIEKTLEAVRRIANDRE